MNLTAELVGWAGSAMILLAYWLMSSDRISSKTALYQWLNVVGSIGLVINGVWHHSIPLAVLDIIWCGIGLMALWQLRASRNNSVIG